MYVVAVVDIVMVELDVVRVGLSAILEGELLAVLDMIFKSVVVHDKPSGFVSDVLLMFLIGRLVG